MYSVIKDFKDYVSLPSSPSLIALTKENVFEILYNNKASSSV